MTSRNLISGLCATVLGLSAHASLTTDLVVYYDFENLTNDPLASGPDATETGTGSYTGIAGGVVGNAAEFTGTADDFIDTAIGFGGGGGDELGNSFTVAAWYNLDTDAVSPASRFFVFEEAGDFDLSYGLRSLEGDGIYDDSQTFTNGAGSVSHPDVHTQGTWQHVAITYESDGSDTTITTYIDGRAVSVLSGTTSVLTGSAIHIGNARSDSLTRAFDGKIDEFAAWKRVLSPHEVSEVRLRGAAGHAVTADLSTIPSAVINAISNIADGGTVIGTGVFELNQTTEITAVAGVGYDFDQWTGDFAGQPATFIHTVTGDVVATAVFTEDLSDSDGDGLSNYDEIRVYNTQPDNPDSDGDLIPDGVEVNTTGTDPNLSDDLAVDYILANLCTGGAGPEDIVLTRDSGTDSVTVKITADDSATLGAWDPVLPTDAAASGLVGGDLQLVLPGTADPAKFFRFAGADPVEVP